MRKLGVITAAAALAAVLGFGGAAEAQVSFPFDGDLVGYWHFETNAGAANADDGSGNGNDGVMQGDATRDADVPDLPNNTNSVALDPSVDSDDYVEITDDDDLDVTDAITLSACIKVDADTGTHQGVIAKWDSPGDDRSYEIVLLRISATDLRPEMFISTDGTGAGNEGVVGSSGINPGDGLWHHVVGTFESDDTGSVTDEVKVYLDGTQIGTHDAPTNATIHVSATPVLIGAENVAPSLFVEGKIDEARIYDVALSQAQIDQMNACDFPDNAELAKELTSGPDVDVGGGGPDGLTDEIVPVGESTALTENYDFTIEYTAGTLMPDAIVFDTVPAEWQVKKIDGQDPNDNLCFDNITNSGGGTVDAAPGNDKCNREKSATIVEWNVEGVAVGELVVDVLNRESPDTVRHSNKTDKFKPTECGAIFLNDGAIAFKSDGSGNLLLNGGNPIPIAGPTDPICLAAVIDPDNTVTNGEPSRSATADHDDDDIASLFEACNPTLRTDPCLTDTDGDGVDDDVDNCPLISNPGAGQTADVDSDGVGTACDADDNNGGVGVAQCADGIDNDGDGAIDDSTSALSTKGGDSDCSSPTDNDESP